MLSIAGSDSSGGAGVQSDQRILEALGCRVFCAVTAVTAQNTRGVQRICHLPPRIVEAQIDAICRDFPVDAVKIGMLGRGPMVRAVAGRLLRRNLSPVVLDPVLAAKDGRPLLVPGALESLISDLLPRCAVVTPNAAEAGLLTRLSVLDLADARQAAQALHALGAPSVLIKGGHLQEEPVDLLYDGARFVEIRGERITTAAPLHGTGCIHSSALAAGLAQGHSLPDACVMARRAVEAALRTAEAAGSGWTLARPGFWKPAEE